MKPIILYREDVDWKQERDVAAKHFECTNSRMIIEAGNLVIPRFSALPFYKEQEFDINYVGARMINTYRQHQYIADIGNWYNDLYEVTPQTWDELYKVPDNIGPLVLKGETNSKKFLWNTHMFAKDKREASEVHSRLCQDSMLQYQKIYFRQYIPLEKLGQGFQGLPITKEYRFFVYKDTVLSGGFYWSSHTSDLFDIGIKPDPKEVPMGFLNDVINKIQNTDYGHPPNFYVIDVAKTQLGKWIVIELNDGCMSGLSDNDPDEMYRNLKECLTHEI